MAAPGVPGARQRRLERLQQDLGRDGRGAAVLEELDAGVQVGLARRELLSQRKRIAGLDQDVQAPALDLGLLALVTDVCLVVSAIVSRVFVVAWTIPAARSWSILYRPLIARDAVERVDVRRGSSRRASSSRPRRSTARSNSRASRVGSLFSQLAHPLLEGERGGLHVALELARDGSLDSLALAALELDERDVQARAGIALRALDPLGDRLLARAQALADLLDRPPPLDRLAPRAASSASATAALAACSSCSRSRSTASRCSVAVEPSSAASASIRASTSATAWLVLLLEARRLRLEVLLHPVDVVRERAQPLLDAALHRRQLGRERVADSRARARRATPRARPRGAAPPPRASRSSRRARGRAGAELLRVRGRLLLDDRAQLPLRASATSSFVGSRARVRARRSASQSPSAPRTRERERDDRAPPRNTRQL